MNFRYVSAALVLMAGVLSAQSSPDLSTLEGLVGEWTELRAAIADERREWERQREFLERELDLLRRDLARLNTEKSELVDVSTSAEEEQAELLAEKERLRARLDAFRPVLDRAEAAMRQTLERVPATLAAGLEAAVERLPDTPEAAADMRVVDRVQALAGVMTAVEDLQHGIHVTRQLLPDGEGGQRQVEVLYMGLARGFAVSSSGDWAAVGVPGENGWNWSPRPEQAEAVRQAIAVVEQQVPAALVPLPLGVVELGEGP